jgi:hypothetical protein
MSKYDEIIEKIGYLSYDELIELSYVIKNIRDEYDNEIENKLEWIKQ